MSVSPSLRSRLEEAERELLALAEALDRPICDEPYLLAQLMLAHRSRSLLRGFIQLSEGPVPVAALALLRPLVEINIFMRFLIKDRELHLELWLAEGDRGVLVLNDEFAANETLRARWGEPPLSEDERTSLSEAVAEARRRASDAGVGGVGKRGPVLPSTIAQLDTINEPGAREAYTLAYRPLSPEVHAGARAFRRGSVKREAHSTVTYSDDLRADDVLPARALALTTFASTLAIASAELGLEIDGAVDEIKHRFVPSP